MLKIIFFSFCMLSFNVLGEEHGHEKEHKDEHQDKHQDKHQDEHHKDEHDEKTIDGFKLSATAAKNFELTYVDYKLPAIALPATAIFKGLSEVNLYRLRNGLYKRIDFKTVEKSRDTIKVNSPDLLVGDKIVVTGIGFLRIAEIAASGGLSDSHSH